MCGIIGCTGVSDAASVIVSGLHTLEYRGYDSSGIAYFDRDGGLRSVKSAGKIRALEAKLSESPVLGAGCAIGHTRWATHGAPTDANSHPHGTPRVQLVHNGIIENYAEIKRELIALGYRFSSETDTEAAALLLDRLSASAKSNAEAVLALTERLVGSFALGILFLNEPDTIYAVRRGSPLMIGVGEGETFLTSDLTAILAHTDRYFTLEEGELAILRKAGVSVLKEDGTPVQKPLLTAAWDAKAVKLEGHPHFMHKEICEEPNAIAATLCPRLKGGLPDFSAEGLDEARLVCAERIIFVSCGTAYHASLVARRAIERLARIRVETEIASEFRYRDPILSPRDVVVAVSQSGETADTLAALRLAREVGAYVVGVVNVVGSAVARESDAVLYTHAGPEIAVASTKAYTVQTALLTLLAVRLAQLKGRLDDAACRSECEALAVALPDAIRSILDRESELAELAKELAEASHAFFIGRCADADAAAEASLKLKEITYLHSEAYAAGELKHGTISLIEQGTPVVALSTELALREKMIGNVKEVAARGARTLIFASPEDAEDLAEVSDALFLLPSLPPIATPIAVQTALQLLAYHTAALRGCDVDQPRNLAKSVTVE